MGKMRMLNESSTRSTRASSLRTRWNLFDLIIIGASWIPADTSMAAIRLLRILRLVRITGRLKSFQLILKTLRASLVGIGSLLLLLLGIMTLYAILGTGLFGQKSELFGDFFCLAVDALDYTERRVLARL